MACDEFSLIARYFDRVGSSRLDVGLDIDGDRAFLNIPERQALAISTDTLVVGSHFLPDIDPTDLAYKTLAVSLGDLATTGADPAWSMLTLTLPDVDKAWFELFSDSPFDLLNYHDIQLIGGDTTCGPLSMTLGIHGFVPMGRALMRSGAKPGDWTYVTGIPGDSAAGLAILQSRLQAADVEDTNYLIRRHLRPSSRILQGQALRDLVNSAIDLSDGLISDLGHIAKASDCGAHIDLASPPFSDALSRRAEPGQALRWTLSGSGDYGSCFTVPELNRGTLNVALGYLDVPFTCTRQMAADIKGLYFIHDDESVTLDWRGHDHFAMP